MEGERETLKYLKYFLLVVAVAAFISLSYKLFTSITQSSFKYDTINLLIISKDASLVRINKARKKLSVISFPKDVLNADDRLALSLKLGVPLDGVMRGNFTVSKEKFLDMSIVFRMIFDRGFKHEKVNAVDIVKIFLETGRIMEADRSFDSVSSLESVQEKLDIGKADFYDQKVFNEKRSVQVINSTGVDGLGSRLAQILRSRGYNVVEIGTGEDSKSEFFTEDLKSVSFERLLHFLSFPVLPRRDPAISDITIVLGKDFKKFTEKIEEGV